MQLPSKRPFVLLLSAVLIFQPSISQINLDKDSLDFKLHQWLPDVKENTPGCVVGIMYKDAVIYTRALGSANIELNVPLSQTSVFNIGSVSKQFTGFAIMQLEEAGKLKLDDRAAKYLPEYEVLQKNNITINDLLHHTSGLREMFELLEISDNQVYGLTMDQIKYILLKQKKLNSQPGQFFEYINTNFLFLALVVERVSGMSFPEYMQEKIFVPLDMKTATVLDDDSKLLANRTSAYIKKNATTYIRANPIDNFYGPGGIYCSLYDLFKWGSNFIHKNIGGAALYEKFLTKGTYRNGVQIKYANGLYIDDYKGIKIIEHEGSRIGYTSQFVYLPEKEALIVILANSRNFPVRDIYRKIMEYLFAGQFPELKIVQTPKPVIPAITALTSQELKKFSGVYWNSASDLRRSAYFKNDTLRYQRTPTNESVMLPIGKNTFILKVGQNLTNNKIMFISTLSKNYRMIFIPEVGDTSFYQPVDTIQTDKKDIYAGLFYNDEIDTKFEIKMNNNGIALKIKGWDLIELQPGFKDYFFNADFGGSIYFQRNKQGKVISFIYTSPRTKNLMFQKIKF